MKFKAGQFSGNFGSFIDVLGPDEYLYIPDPENPLTFTRPDGSVRVLDFSFPTDIGSIPAWARFRTRLSKGYYNIAYLFHDAEYERKKQGLGPLSFEEANLLCAECIVTLQTVGWKGRKYSGGQFTAKVIYRAISSFVGKMAWRRIKEPT